MISNTANLIINKKIQTNIIETDKMRANSINQKNTYYNNFNNNSQISQKNSSIQRNQLLTWLYFTILVVWLFLHGRRDVQI